MRARKGHGIERIGAMSDRLATVPMVRAMLVRTILIAVMAASCAVGERSADPGVLMIEEKEQTASFIRNFNPLLEVGDVRWPATHSMYEPMLIFNWATGEYVPWLATAYAWSDGHKTLRF